MEAVEIARGLRNPALSAEAFFAAAGAVQASDPQTALVFIEDSLALIRAGAVDALLGNVLIAGCRHPGPEQRPARSAGRAAGSGGAATRRWQPARARHDTPGRRRDAGPARRSRTSRGAVRSSSAHFPASLSAANEDERTAVDEAQALARHTLGEAAYSAALGRGAAMDQDKRRRVRAGRVPADRRPARRTRGAGTGIAASHGRGQAAGHDHVSRPATNRRSTATHRVLKQYTVVVQAMIVY